MSAWQLACRADDVPEGGAVHVDVAGQPVCVARSGGTLYAVRDICSHAEVRLSEGEVDDGTVECWLHGSRFDLATGRPIGLPATQPVPVYAVKHDGDDVLVSLEGSSQ